MVTRNEAAPETLNSLIVWVSLIRVFILANSFEVVISFSGVLGASLNTMPLFVSTMQKKKLHMVCFEDAILVLLTKRLILDESTTFEPAWKYSHFKH